MKFGFLVKGQVDRTLISAKENVEMKHFNLSALIYSISDFIYQKT